LYRVSTESTEYELRMGSIKEGGLKDHAVFWLECRQMKAQRKVMGIEWSQNKPWGGGKKMDLYECQSPKHMGQHSPLIDLIIIEVCDEDPSGQANSKASGLPSHYSVGPPEVFVKV
jgi:hypothetical protein